MTTQNAKLKMLAPLLFAF